MYGQGNYASPVGQGPYPSRRPFQQPPQGPPPPAFQQGPLAPRPPMYQHGHLPIPPLVGQPGHPAYQHVPPGPPQQVPQLPVPSTGISSGQSYLSPHPPPPPPLQAHGGSQVPHFHSSAQQQSQWAQNAHHVPPAVPSSGPGNVMPPPLQGQVLYRGQVPPGGVQVPQHAPPPPPLPPLSSSFPPPSFSSNAIPMPQHPQMASMVPPRPPLPSSPPQSPPRPPASPPPMSSSPGSKAKAQFSESILRQGPNNDSTDDVMASASNDRIGAPNQSGDSLRVLCNHSEHDGVTCSAGQPDNLVDAGKSHSPCDSDMDMEDDITHPDEEEQSHSFSDPTCGSFPTCTEQEKSDQLQTCSGAGKHTLAEDTCAGKLSCSVSSHLEDQEQVFAVSKVSRNHDGTPGKSSPKVDSSVLNSIGQTDLPFNSIACGSSSPHVDLIKPSASADVAGNGSEKLSKENSQGTSPFRLLQDYASDDSSENGHDKDVNPVAVSPSAKAGIFSFGTGINHSFGDGLRSGSLLGYEKGFDPVPESSAVCSRSIPPQSMEASLLERIVSQADAISIATGEVEELVDNKHENQEFSEVHSSPKVLQNTNALRDDIVDGPYRSVNFQKEDPKSISGVLKVDEFGRLVRDNPSDCDSGDSPHYTRRHGRRGRSRSPKRGRSRSRSHSPLRGRSRSRSQSPLRGRSRSRSRSPLRGRSRSRSRSPYDSRRRRRSPWRRRERRGRSRSLSPKRHRSRSKSPLYRRGGELGDKMRRDKALPPECFDFIRGKCYRGASCRYLHHESDKTERSRSYRSKQQKDVQTSSKSTDLYGKNETTSKRSVDGHNGFKQDLLVMEKREDVKEELGNSTTQLHGKESCVDPPVRQVASAENENIPGSFADPAPTSKNSETQQSQVHCFDQVIQNADHQHQKMNDSLGPQISPVRTSGTAERVPPVNRPYLNQYSASQSYAGMSSADGHFSSRDISSQTLPELSPSGGHHPSHLLPSFPSLSEDASANFSQQMTRDFNLISPTTKFPHQHSQFPVPSTSSWNSLPLPPPHLPYVNHSNVTSGHYGLPSAQFQQNMSPRRNDFPYGASVRPYGTEFLSVSQGGQQETYPTVQEAYRSSYHRDDFGPGTLPVMSKPMVQPHLGPGPRGEDCTIGRPPQDIYTKSSFSHDNLHPEHPSFPSDSPSKRMHTFPGDKMSPGGFSAPSSQSYPYLRQPFYGLPPAPEGASTHLGEPGKVVPTMSRYTSDNFEKDRPSHLPAFTGSRFSSHFNPYASTFDQPLSSKFSSNILTQEKDISYSNKYGTLYNLSHVPADGLAVAAKGSSLTPVGDQYDPLCDSIEPTSTSVKKPDFGQQHEQTDDSDIMLRMSVSNKPLDVEEHNKQKGSGAVARTISLENDEYGETADAEVGAVENGSASNPHDTTDMAAGDVEIDQVKPPGKTKISKESKSMKLFKIAIADFVKEVLKPSWRQGNMSKEAFKTIVKKTVDKVSGALKSHQVPKSRAKIDHYIDSSRRKLTKLVMGYVDKYVKV